VEVHAVGKKGISFFRFQREEMASTRADISDRPTAEDADSLIGPLMERFVAGELDAVYVVYAQFNSALSTPPTSQQVLPIPAPAEGETGGADVEYILEPSADAILSQILPLYVRNSIYRALVETAAAEQGSRRTAMKSATDNAGDMLKSLTRTYNRARQAQITQEIAEIVGGAAALE
jgi:F-type H+-transporting ATPase subunit gamma